MASKSWMEKLADPKPHMVKPALMDFAGMKRGEMMLVPSPRIVDRFIRTIPKGRSIDIPALRKRLARRYGAEVTCPATILSFAHSRRSGLQSPPARRRAEGLGNNGSLRARQAK